MSYDLPKFEGRLTVPTGGYVMTVTDSGGTAAVTVLAAGDYYPNSSTAFLAAIAAALTANATLAGTYTCTSDDDASSSTGRVTITCSGGGNPTIVWTSTALRDALGFTAGLSGAATYTSTNACPYIFLPDVARAYPMAPDGSRGVPITDGTFTQAPSGQAKVLTYAERYVDALEFQLLSGRKARAQFETYTGESLESWWRLVLSRGLPFRYHYDRATDGAYVTYRCAQPSVFAIKPYVPGYVGGPSAGATLRWNFGPVDLVEYVA